MLIFWDYNPDNYIISLGFRSPRELAQANDIELSIEEDELFLRDYVEGELADEELDFQTALNLAVDLK